MAGAAIGAGAGGLLGLVNANQKKGEYNRQKQLAADIERNSPWTGVHGQMPQEAPSTLNSVLQGATSGAMMGGPGGMIGSLMGGKSQGGGMPQGQSPWGAMATEDPNGMFGQDQYQMGMAQKPKTMY